MLPIIDDQHPASWFDFKLLRGKRDYAATGVLTIPLNFFVSETPDTERFRHPDLIEKIGMLFSIAHEGHPWIDDGRVVHESRRVTFLSEEAMHGTGYRFGYQCVIEPDGWTHNLSKGQLHAYEKHLLGIARSFERTLRSIGLIAGHVAPIQAKMLTTKKLL